MLQTAIPMPSAPPNMVAAQPRMNIGGVMQISGLKHAMADRAAMNPSVQDTQSQPVLTGLVGHIHNFWQQAKTAKLIVEDQMIEALLARRGEYTSAKLQQIQDQRQPAIYMMLAAAKMRQIEALLRDVLIGAGTEKPWTLEPTPSPDLPPELTEQIVQGLTEELQQAMQMGLQPSMSEVRERLRVLKGQVTAQVMEEARVRSERMETKMEDQLQEGGFNTALDEFVTDLATYKTAFLLGPVVRKKPTMEWAPGGVLIVQDKLMTEWERVDPFDVYPAAWAKSLNRAPLIIRRRLSRSEINAMMGAPGYDVDALKQVLDQYGSGGLHDWLSIDSRRAVAEGKSQVGSQSDELIDALWYFGSASGKMLIEWGLDKSQVPDPSKEYEIDAWLIGNYVVKAQLNADPLMRRPLYSDSFHMVPGSVWGNSPYDLMSDCQEMCNATARSLAANMGISSGPQVGIISSRLPANEDVTEMFPWKIWQFNADPTGSTASPITFFQPESNAPQLMAVYTKFSDLADEYTGIPKYMTGLEGGGVGRTSSGLSMMLGSSGKIIKQVVSGIDTRILEPMLSRLYYFNMRYGDDPDLKGDVRCCARGALSMQTKEAAQQRRNEFLQATANPIDMQIMGMEGRAEVLRASASTLDLNTDRVVPPVAILKQRAQMAQAQQAQQSQIAGPPGQSATPGPSSGGANNAPAGPGGAMLQDGSPVTNHFSPTPR